ncbi:MAG: hypothetical protein EOO38_16210 [Cytophagaceae bacterium]|nr:MAG: hypothetical protein EOO38_16210 [Cytophagaceae bacterium]
MFEMDDHDRANEELEIKRKLLKLEQDKFDYLKISSFKDRVSTNALTGVRTLMVAHASAIVFSIAYRDPLVKTLTTSIANFELYAFILGLMLAMVSYIEVLNISMWSIADIKEVSSSNDKFPSAFSPMSSMVLFGLALVIPIVQISSPDDFAAIGSWFSSIGKRP